MVNFIAGLLIGGLIGIAFVSCTLAAKERDEIPLRGEEDGK